jgi:excisionase family DNA binding protein
MQLSTAATTPHPDLLTLSEAAELLRVSRATAYRLVSAGELPALRVGHGLRIDRAELHEYLYGTPRPEDPECRV